MTTAIAAPPKVVTVDDLCNRFAGPGKDVDWSLVYEPMQRRYREGLAFCLAEGVHAYATCGTRTYQRQMTDYLKGRKTPGPHAGEPNYPALGLRVTRARPGESDHNFGIAIDSTLDKDLAKAGLQPDWEIAHYEPYARNMQRVGLKSLFYSAKFREGPHVALDIEGRGLSRHILRTTFEKRGLRDLRTGLADVWALLDRHGPW
jgi:hypothetical protein